MKPFPASSEPHVNKRLASADSFFRDWNQDTFLIHFTLHMLTSMHFCSPVMMSERHWDPGIIVVFTISTREPFHHRSKWMHCWNVILESKHHQMLDKRIRMLTWNFFMLFTTIWMIWWVWLRRTWRRSNLPTRTSIFIPIFSITFTRHRHRYRTCTRICIHFRGQNTWPHFRY